jgi:hypothetical protein
MYHAQVERKRGLSEVEAWLDGGARTYPAEMEATPERFRALARSSPWRWTTLRCVLTSNRAHADPEEPIRIHLSRPKLARIERLDGEPISVHRERPQTAGVLSRGRRSQTVTLPDPSTVTPELDSDGLVRSRPGTWQVDHDTPVLGSYYEVALFDPVELADGGDEVPGTTIEDVRAVEHHGRPAWEAIVHPTGAYAPSRCSCCALLTSDAVDGEDPDTAEVDLAFVYPDAHRVRLDVGTGICVEVARLTGSRAGRGHVLRIEAVDEPIDDALFTPVPRPPRRFLSSRWSGGR